MKAQSVKTQSEIKLNGLKQPTATRIIRAVASSTAIETGQSVEDLESRLLAQNSKFQELALGTV